MAEQVRWWVPPEKADPEIEALRAGNLLDETSAIEMRQSAWHELNLWNSTLYTGRELPGFSWGAVDNADTELWPTNLRTENLIAEIGEAMLSKASSSPLKPTPVPHGNSYKTERAVRLLDQFLLGVWRQTGAETACIQMFRDAFMTGMGCIEVGYETKSGALTVTPVFFDNVIIDNRECAYRQAPKVYRIRTVVPRAQVESQYGVTLGNAPKRYHEGRECAEGWEIVVKAYRMPDADGKGGRCVTACCDKILEDVAWNHDWVPLVFFHWQDRTSGFFVPSGVEQIVPYQLRHNELNDDIKEAQDLTCRPRLAVNANTQINVNEWDNKAGRLLMWAGSKPEPIVWPSNLAELYQERERNRDTAFKRMAVSPMFANAELPQQVRLDSSAGVREQRNLEDSRHLRMWSNFEQARLGVARAILNVLSISKGADAFTSVYHPGGAKASAKSIPYAAVKQLTEDKFSWTLEAVPLSQMSPAARREAIRDWSSRQLIDSDEARRMEGNPNLERLEDLEMAASDDILRHMSILEDGDYEAPSELTNCTLGIRKVTANYFRLKNYEDVPDRILQNHIKWVVTATAIQQAATQPAPEMPAFAPTQGVAGTSAAQAPRTVVNNNGPGMY